MTQHRFVLAALLAAAGFGTAHAAPLSTSGQWATFDVSQDLSGNLGWIDIGTGNALSFTFTVLAGQTGTLTVVDAGFAGDTFQVKNGAQILGTTGAATANYPTSIGLDFDAALANPSYSRGVYTLPSGAYSITGSLVNSVIVGGQALNSTVGGINLTVSAVPEPATALSLLAGLGLLASRVRRRAA
jgi:hypothetical protein